MATNLNQYYSEKGQALPTVQARSSIYESMGLGGAAEYKGTADQNTRLLQALANGSPAPVQPAAVPQVANVQQAAAAIPIPGAAAPQAGGSEQQLIQAMVQKGHNEQTARAAIAGRGYQDLAREYLGATGGGMAGMQQPALNLPQLYESLYNSSGIKQREEELSQKEQQLAMVKAKINDNPFLSEGTRVGRVAKLDQLYNDQTAGIRKDIDRARADVEMKLNLETKQFDIQSQQAQQALNQFNSLLESGALDSASSDDLASLTRSTGINSNLIASAINARKQANMNTEIKTFDDGFEEGFVIYTIDPMGNIVNQTRQVTGKSAKKVNAYSTDPIVSDFIQRFMEQEGGGNISDIWNEAGQGY